MAVLLKYKRSFSLLSAENPKQSTTTLFSLHNRQKSNKSNVELNFLSKDNEEPFKDTMTRVINMGTDFKTRDKVLEYAKFDEIMRCLNEPLPQESTELSHILDMFEDYVLPHSTNFSSPFSMGFPDAGNSVAALTGAVLSDFLNQNLISWMPASPVATVLEIIVLNWIRQLVGYDAVVDPKLPKDVGGFITTGGVLSNAAALLFAREVAYPGTMQKGISNIERKYVVLIPADIDHYSIRHACGWLGIGEDNVVSVPTKHFKYDLKALKDTIDRLEKNNIRIIALTCYAGDGYTLTCDDFVELRKICDSHNIWMHVDGCYGTQLLFSKNLKHVVRGIELADSITFDPHKVMCVPYVCSVVLLRDPKTLIQRTEGIVTGEEHSFGQITPFFGSRSFLSLKLYMLIKHLGVNQLGAMIEERHKMALILAQKVTADAEMVLLNLKVDMNAVIFMYVPHELSALLKSEENRAVEIINQLNGSIADVLLQRGDVWLHTFLLPDSSDIFQFKAKGRMLRVLRFNSGNPNITERHIDIMLNMVKTHGKSILENIQKSPTYKGP